MWTDKTVKHSIKTAKTAVLTMIKRLFMAGCFPFIFPVLCCIVLFPACESPVISNTTPAPAVLIYMAADNNLDYYAIANIRQMEQGLSGCSESNIFVFIDRNSGGSPSHPYLLRLNKNTESSGITSPILRVYPEQNTCNPDFLRKVIADVKDYSRQRNAELRRLVLWSHGTGWLPEGTPFNEIDDENEDINSKGQPPLFSFGLDNNGGIDGTSYQKEMEITDLASALDGEHFDLLLLDACFMGTIEAAYEFRQACDYLIASPSEILSSGFPYIDIINNLVCDIVDPLEVAEKIFNYYNNQKGIMQSAAISIIDTRYLTKLALEMELVYMDYLSCRDSLPISSFLQYDRTGSNYFFDFKNFIFSLSEQTKKDYSGILNCYQDTLPYYMHTVKMFNTLDLTGTEGLSIYIPNTFLTRSELHAYYKSLSWAQDSHAGILFD